MNNQLPPACIQAEEAILGCILFDPKIIAAIQETLPVEAFYVGSHQTIYQSMLYCHKKGLEPNYVTLVTYLEDYKVLEAAGGTVKLSQLLAQTVSSTNCDRFVQLIVSKYERRKLITIGHEIVELGYDQTVELSELYKQIRELLPQSVTETSPKVSEPVITKAMYSVYSQSGQKKIELEANIAGDWNLADSIASVAAKAKLIAESLWGEEIK